MTEELGYPADLLADAEVVDSEAWYIPDGSESWIWKQGLFADCVRDLLSPDQILKVLYILKE